MRASDRERYEDSPFLRNRETSTPLTLLRFARFPLPAGERERRFAARSLQCGCEGIPLRMQVTMIAG